MARYWLNTTKYVLTERKTQTEKGINITKKILIHFNRPPLPLGLITYFFELNNLSIKDFIYPSAGSPPPLLLIHF